MTKGKENPTEKSSSAGTINASSHATAARYSSVQTTQALRNLAVKIKAERISLTPEDLQALSPEKLLQMLHELQVNQVELELQNDELRWMHEELTAAKTRYANLYDLAPIGYLTINAQGKILEANLTATILLGTPRSALVGQPIYPFIRKEHRDIYYLFQKQLIESGKLQVCELQMTKQDATTFWAQLQATITANGASLPECHMVLNDITERKQAEELKQQIEALRASNEDLIQFNDAAVGRELRMIELKEEINKLCKQTGQSSRYALDFRMRDVESNGQ